MIHHAVYGADADADTAVLRTGAEVGCSLVDGNGDGVRERERAAPPLRMRMQYISLCIVYTRMQA